MRAVAAMMKHETNTFSPVPTPLARFGPDGPSFGNQAAEMFRGTNTALGAYLTLCEAEGWAVETPVAGSAPPSGRVEAAAYRTMCEAILAAVERGCDALFLDLHGAMVPEGNDDGEGHLLEEIRRRRPDLPIAVAYDLHANVTARMIENATVTCGYLTYPHIDIAATGSRAGGILRRALKGEVSPVTEWARLPMIPHTLKMAHADEPMKSLLDAAKAAVDGRVILDVSVFGGFPMVDIAEPGLSVVVVADGDRAAARAVRDRLIDMAWDRRADFVWQGRPLADSVAEAMALPGGPVILLDHVDNCASGGTQDVMAVIGECLRQGMTDLAVFAVKDPAAVRAMQAAGPGASLTLALGGKTDMPAIGRRGEPLTVTGRVKALSDGRFRVTGPMMTGTLADMGHAGVLDLGDGVEIVVCSKNMEPSDLGCLRSLGIEPTAKRRLLLKSRVHFRAGFEPIAAAMVYCDGVGVTSSDYSLFDFRVLKRPCYPLDPGASR